jgi:hypothetical protein
MVIGKRILRLSTNRFWCYWRVENDRLMSTSHIVIFLMLFRSGHSNILLLQIYQINRVNGIYNYCSYLESWRSKCAWWSLVTCNFLVKHQGVNIYKITRYMTDVSIWDGWQLAYLNIFCCHWHRVSHVVHGTHVCNGRRWRCVNYNHIVVKSK